MILIACCIHPTALYHGHDSVGSTGKVIHRVPDWGWGGRQLQANRHSAVDGVLHTVHMAVGV